MAFNIAALFFFLIWGLVYLCKRKGKNQESDSHPINARKTPVARAPRAPSRPLISILKPCGTNIDSDEIEDDSEMYNEEDFSGNFNYNPDVKTERRAHFAAEPFLISN